jgi:hypothetical protein
MAFALGVEIINMKIRKKTTVTPLRGIEQSAPKPLKADVRKK